MLFFIVHLRLPHERVRKSFSLTQIILKHSLLLTYSIILIPMKGDFRMRKIGIFNSFLENHVVGMKKRDTIE